MLRGEQMPMNPTDAQNGDERIEVVRPKPERRSPLSAEAQEAAQKIEEGKAAQDTLELMDVPRNPREAAEKRLRNIVGEFDRVIETMRQAVGEPSDAFEKAAARADALLEEAIRTADLISENVTAFIRPPKLDYMGRLKEDRKAVQRIKKTYNEITHKSS